MPGVGRTSMHGKNCSKKSVRLPVETRKSKKREIFRILLSGDKYSQSDLSIILGCSKATVLSIVNELKDERFIEEKKLGKSKSGGGKRPVILGVRRRGVYVFVAGSKVQDDGTRAIEVALINLEGKKIFKRLLPIDDEKLPESILQAIFRLINSRKKILLAKEPDARIIAGIFAVSGRVDPVSGELIASSGCFKRFIGLPIKKMMAEATGLNCFVDDEAVFPAFAEYYMGEAAHREAFVYLEVLPFIRAVFFMNGFLYRGESLLAGQVGASLGRMGDCDNQYLCDLFDHEIFGMPLIQDRKEQPGAQSLLYDFSRRLRNASHNGDKVKKAALARITGQTIVNLICYIDIPFIVLGGVPEEIREEFREMVVKEVEKFLYFYRPGDFEINFSEHGFYNSDKAMGFVCYSVENLFA